MDVHLPKSFSISSIAELLSVSTKLLLEHLVVTMCTSLVIFSVLAVSAMADMMAFTNANSFGAMLKRGDTILKRQGYTPDTTYCGRGDTCAEACGANSVECPSSDTSMFYCHDSNDGSVRSSVTTLSIVD